MAAAAAAAAAVVIGPTAELQVARPSAHSLINADRLISGREFPSVRKSAPGSLCVRRRFALGSSKFAAAAAVQFGFPAVRHKLCLDSG